MRRYLSDLFYDVLDGDGLLAPLAFGASLGLVLATVLVVVLD